MSKLTELASSRLNHSRHPADHPQPTDDLPPSVIVHWPAMPTVIDPKAFPAAADAAVRTFRQRGCEVGAASAGVVTVRRGRAARRVRQTNPTGEYVEPRSRAPGC
jgi:hypothetical protein